MTVLEAIGLADEMKPNSVPQGMKVRWLCVLDGLIWRNVFRTHGRRGAFQPYDPDTDLHRELLVKAPYDTLYRRWLEAQIDLSNGNKSGTTPRSPYFPTSTRPLRTITTGITGR